MIQYKFFPHTEEDVEQMLSRIGIGSLDDLYKEVPEEIRFRRNYHLPEAMSEQEIRNFFRELGSKNQQLTIFAGGGVYDHYTPSIIPHLVARSEFLTSYTPYQAEISQGTLHYIFEFQSMMAELTGMPISNASMYDGSTATAEAALMAVASAKKADRVLVSQTVDEKILAVIKTYAHFQSIRVDVVEAEEGVTSRSALVDELKQGGVAGVIVQQPNKYGIVEDYEGWADICHNEKALFIMNANPADLALLKTPAELGADIAVGDGQSLGIPMSFGGPSVLYGEAHEEDAGADCRENGRQQRATRLCSHPSGPRTTHPTRESHL